MNRTPPHICADCGRRYFDIADGQLPRLDREPINQHRRITHTKAGYERETITTTYRYVTPLVGTIYIVARNEHPTQVYLCHLCATVRGYREADDDAATIRPEVEAP